MGVVIHGAKSDEQESPGGGRDFAVTSAFESFQWFQTVLNQLTRS
jgi:hypothetical protein